MKTTTVCRILAGSFLILLGGVGAVVAVANAQRTSLSIDDRMMYQRRIEEVYWRHRTATQTGDRAVTFAEVMPDTAIREKVEDTLRKSAALATYWQRPVTGAQLQAEISRMAAQTRQPDVLRELWNALDNDPYVIAECLARPLLVERELGAWYAHDARFHGALRSSIEAELQAKSGGAINSLSGTLWERQVAKGNRGSNKSQFDADTHDTHATTLSEAEWQRVVAQIGGAFGQSGGASVENLPVGRVSGLQENETEFFVVALRDRRADQLTIATMSWPKQSVDVWWQSVRNDLPVSTEESSTQTYELPQIAQAPVIDDTWAPTAAPLSARESHTAIWTGSEMIVWGGFFNPSNFTDYFVTVAGRYNPATDTWHLTSTVNAPTWRERHTAVWTGSEMIVWGGYGGTTGTVNTGARYNPATDTWTPTSTTNAPAHRSRHVAVWTGSRMLVWGGRTGDSDNTTVNTGGSYDPVSNSWTAITTSNAPAPREYFTGVWTGTEMIVWGGYNGVAGTSVNTGGRYNPQSNTWQTTNTSGALAKRYAHDAVWTGTRMLVWGGAEDFFSITRYNDGALYDPVSNTWTAISSTNAPTPRDSAAAVWTGRRMIIWGGFDGDNRLRSGGQYDLQRNRWQLLSTAGAPEGAVLMSAVWTGQEMIVWGGQEPTVALDVNTGARYNPQTNSWVPVTNPRNGGPRAEHPAVWTGAEMIVWGSYTLFSTPTNNGARYYPSTDTWLPTSMVNVPTTRYSPLAVWSGSEMIVWGGCSDGFCFTRLNTGGRYNPATDSWQPATTVNAAEARYWFSAIWSGSEMIVWGGCDAQTCGPGGNSDPYGLNNGGRYNPQTDSWQPLNITGAPRSRWLQTAVWTGNEMIVWGGIWGGGPFKTGGRYDPLTDTWTPTTTINAPTARNLLPAAWTGSRMFVWGGYNSLLDRDLNTGGLYDPATDSWTATSTSNAPSPRAGHSVIWTGEEMIVWGGTAGPNHQIGTNTGGRYNPVTNTWRATSTIEAPSPRDVHSAVWTGSEMIVFGGESCAACQPVLDTGGRYTVGP